MSLHCADLVTFDKGSKQDKSPGLYCSNSLNSHLAGKNRHNRDQGHCRSIESQLNCRVTTIVVAMTPVTVQWLSQDPYVCQPCVGSIWTQFKY